MIPSASTPPLTPSGPSSPLSRWQNQSNIIPTLQLSASRLKSTLRARDMDLDMDMLEHESLRCRRQQLLDEVSGLASPSRWNNGLSTALAFATSGDQPGDYNRCGVKPTNLEDVFGSIDPAILSQLQGLSSDALAPQLQSPAGIQISHNMNQQPRSSYLSSFFSSPVRTPPSFGIDPSGAGAAAVLSSRSAAFAKQRSQSFIDRSAVNHYTGLSLPVSSAAMIPSNLSDWGSPDGKLDWGIQGEELHKLRKSASFGFRSNGSSLGSAPVPMPGTVDEPDVSWVHSLVKDTSSMKPGQLGLEEQQQQCHLTTSGSEMLPAWGEQLYSEQKQLVA
uniref:Uncharacterized protein n=1 Tax=Rhizophora mucronata TaxID=61149 RepID=A0A2P2LMC8_RHIMU